jgi:hypothetical protein
MTGLALRAGRCQCTACGLHFSSVREFERHRAGGYAKPGEWTGERYCRPLEELRAQGWREDARGFLRQGRPEGAPAGPHGRNAGHASAGGGKP